MPFSCDRRVDGAEGGVEFGGWGVSGGVSEVGERGGGEDTGLDILVRGVRRRLGGRGKVRQFLRLLGRWMGWSGGIVVIGGSSGFRLRGLGDGLWSGFRRSVRVGLVVVRLWVFSNVGLVWVLGPTILSASRVNFPTRQTSRTSRNPRRWCGTPHISSLVILLVIIGRPSYICIASPLIISPFRARARSTASLGS